MPVIKNNYEGLLPAFELISKKLKTPITAEDRIAGSISEQLHSQMIAIAVRNEEDAEPELWTPESLCFI